MRPSEAGVIKVGQDIPSSPFEYSAQPGKFGPTAWYANTGQCTDFSFHEGLARARAECAVGIDVFLRALQVTLSATC